MSHKIRQLLPRRGKIFLEIPITPDLKLQRSEIYRENASILRPAEAKKYMGQGLETLTSVCDGEDPAPAGLGNLGGTGDVKGLNMHSAMAMSTAGEPFGLIGQHIWAPVSSGRSK
ncbi:MAG: hypothetical protein GC192_07375, partial [Bacteroidetes bacterium]|nr:hypothetical protein [Bacteroidota bacterium]